MSRNKDHRPNVAAAEGGRPLGAPYIFLIYSLYIPYIFDKYVPYIFPWVFPNLWSQQKTSPYRKPCLHTFFCRCFAF